MADNFLVLWMCYVIYIGVNWNDKYYNCQQFSFALKTSTCLFVQPAKHALYHGLQTPNEDLNQRNLKIWADVADKI